VRAEDFPGLEEGGIEGALFHVGAGFEAHVFDALRGIDHVDDGPKQGIGVVGRDNEAGFIGQDIFCRTALVRDNDGQA